MELWGSVDWERMFVPSTPILEIVLRGTIMYLALFTLLRVILKRQSGAMGITDLLVVVLIADAAQNGMADDYHSVTDGVLLVAVIVGWNFALDWLGYRFPRIQRLVHPPSLRLVEDGRFLYRNMRKELITEEELMSQLREQGIDNVADVSAAYMEGDGRVSVIPREGANGNSGAPKRPLV